MPNCPVTTAHRLFVLGIITNRILQIIIPNNPTMKIYFRYSNQDNQTWSEWVQNAYTKDIPTIDTTLTVSGNVADAKATGDKLNELKT